MYERGSYFLPTVIEGLPNTARMCQEEIFGPVLALLPWHSEQDLLDQCHDNPYGLAAGIWTQDYKTAWRLGSALQTGTVWINTYKVFSISTPFGGLKMSGVGREKGQAAPRESQLGKLNRASQEEALPVTLRSAGVFQHLAQKTGGQCGAQTLVGRRL